MPVFLRRLTQRALAGQPKALGTQIGACAVAVGLAALALQGRHEPASPVPAAIVAAVPAAIVAAVPPVIDPESGKILDRADGSIGEAAVVASLPVNSLLHFAGGLDLSGAGSTQIASMDQPLPSTAAAAGPQPSQTTGARSAARAGAARMRAAAMAGAVPLPPARPVTTQAETVVAEAAKAKDEDLLSRVLPAAMEPSRLLPVGREAWSKVATLGESLVDRLVP
jgi:hypothetical protein